MAIIGGLLVGLGFGYALQRGRFCVNTAFRDVLLIRDSTLLRAWALAVIIQMLGLQLVLAFRLFTPDVPPFWWPANLAGGLAFGMGMVLAGGCASGTCYRTGEGMLGSFVALLGFGLMTVVADSGAASPLQSALRTAPIVMGGAAPTLPGMLGLPAWALAAALASAVGFWLARSRRDTTRRGWTWVGTGVAIGLVALAAWLSSSETGRFYGLSVTGPIRSLFQYAVTGETAFLDWGSYMLLGLIGGAWVGGALHGEAKLRLPQPRRTLQALGGGLLMGFGAQVAGGCNIGHSLTGLAVLSPASLMTTASIVLGAWTMSFLMFMDGPNVLSELFQRLLKLMRPGDEVAPTAEEQP